MQNLAFLVNLAFCPVNVMLRYNVFPADPKHRKPLMRWTKPALSTERIAVYYLLLVFIYIFGLLKQNSKSGGQDGTRQVDDLHGVDRRRLHR